MQSILLIDDHDDFRSIMSTILIEAGYQVFEANCPDQAFQTLQEEHPDLIICDLHMPFTQDDRMQEFQYSYEVGVKTVEELQWALPDVPVLIASAAVPNDIQRMTAHLKSVMTISKPIQPRRLVAMVELLTAPKDQLVLH